MTRLVYILAASHSGSTLLAMLLGTHPEACTAGELKATRLGDIESYRCSCGQRIRQCAFWARVREGMQRRGIDFDITDAGMDLATGGSPYTHRLLRPLHRTALTERVRDTALSLAPTWRTTLRRFQERNAALIETVAEIGGAKVVVDSSKVGLRVKYLLRNPAIDVRVVRLIRDGRGVALALAEPALFADAEDEALRGGGTGGDRADERLAIGKAAHEWRRSNEEAEHVLAGIDKSRWIEVRYEQLCAHPEETLERVFGFLGLKPDRAVLDFRRVDHHVVGNGMRLNSTSEIRLDERWRSELTDEDLRLFDSVAGEVNRRYGYV